MIRFIDETKIHFENFIICFVLLKNDNWKIHWSFLCSYAGKPVLWEGSEELQRTKIVKVGIGIMHWWNKFHQECLVRNAKRNILDVAFVSAIMFAANSWETIDDDYFNLFSGSCRYTGRLFVVLTGGQQRLHS